MTTLSVRAHLSPAELLDAIRQMKTNELEEFTTEVLKITAERRAPKLNKVEAELLLRINHGRPDDFERRYRDLTARRRADALTPEEYTELLRMVEQAEAWNVDRLDALVQLASIRGLSLPDLMEDLGIRAPEPEYAG